MKSVPAQINGIVNIRYPVLDHRGYAAGALTGPLIQHSEAKVQVSFVVDALRRATLESAMRSAAGLKVRDFARASRFGVSDGISVALFQQKLTRVSAILTSTTAGSMPQSRRKVPPGKQAGLTECGAEGAASRRGSP